MTTNRSQIFGSAFRAARGGAGFTLLEVLLAVTILALVVTSVYSTWSAALNGWRRGNEVLESLQRQRIVSTTLDELASSIVYVNGPAVELYEVIGQHGRDGDSVSFVTASDALLPPSETSMGGMRRVTIKLDRDGHGNPFLSIANSPALVVQD